MDTCVAAVTILATACLLVTSPSRAEDSPGVSDSIRINQIGFYPSSPKRAVVINHAGGRFLIKDRAGARARHEGDLGPSQTWDASGEKARIADFSAFSLVGEFVIEVPGLGRSHPFRIDPSVHLDLAKAALKAYYFNRASTEQGCTGRARWPTQAAVPMGSGDSDAPFTSLRALCHRKPLRRLGLRP